MDHNTLTMQNLRKQTVNTRHKSVGNGRQGLTECVSSIQYVMRLFYTIAIHSDGVKANWALPRLQQS